MWKRAVIAASLAVASVIGLTGCGSLGHPGLAFTVNGQRVTSTELAGATADWKTMYPGDDGNGTPSGDNMIDMFVTELVYGKAITDAGLKLGDHAAAVKAFNSYLKSINAQRAQNHLKAVAIAHPSAGTLKLFSIEAVLDQANSDKAAAAKIETQLTKLGSSYTPNVALNPRYGGSYKFDATTMSGVFEPNGWPWLMAESNSSAATATVGGSDTTDSQSGASGATGSDDTGTQSGDVTPGGAAAQ
jgi:hypothetical protein